MGKTTPIATVRVYPPGRNTPERSDIIDGPGGTRPRLTYLSYKDVEKSADVCKLEFNNFDLVFPDVPLFDRGNRLAVSWGYPGNMAPEREVVVVDWTPGPVFQVEAHGSVILMNKLPVDQTYYGKSYSAIAREIAQRNGYGADVQDIEESGIDLPHVLQPHWTDAQLLRQMATKLGWVFYVDQTGFHFHQRRLGQQPRVRWVYYRSGMGDLREHPKFAKAPAANPGAVTVKGIDPKTNKPIAARADNASTAGRPGVTPVIEVIDAKTATTSLKKKVAPELVTTTTAATPAAAKKEAAAIYQRAQSNPVKCSCSNVRGDPQFVAKSLVELSGLGERLSGPYYCVDVEHVIRAGEYGMSATLQRDGHMTAGSGGAVIAPKSAAKTNTQAAPSASQKGKLKEVEVPVGRTGQTKIEYRPADNVLPGPRVELAQSDELPGPRVDKLDPALLGPRADLLE